MNEPNQLSAAAAAKAIAEGKLTSEALVRACLDRIEAREPEVLAWAHLDPEKALAQARARDKEASRGPLHGVPVAVKDVIDTADMPSEYNSPIYKGHRPKVDAACVALTRRAGGVILGKTVTTEFANRHPGPTRNPHNPRHTPGGSSSGSGAGVADFMVPLGYGTQTGGSIIRPAAYCGVVGYKPTFNTINRAGLKFLSESLDTLGVLARTVEDAALIVAAVSGRPLPDFARKPARAPRIGFCRTSRWEKSEEAARRAFEGAVPALKKAGAEVRDVELPKPCDRLFDVHKHIMEFEAARALAWEATHHRDGLSATIRQVIDDGLATPFASYQDALVTASAARTEIDRLLAGGIDLLLTPSAPGEAPEGLASTGPALFNRIWTAMHVPCVTVPVFKGATGLPIGAQVVGPRHGDAETLVFAHWLHRTLS